MAGFLFQEFTSDCYSFAVGSLIFCLHSALSYAVLLLLIALLLKDFCVLWVSFKHFKKMTYFLF